MLYEMWQQTVQSRPDEVAWRDLAANTEFTFRQINQRANQQPQLQRGSLLPISTQAGALELVIQTLRAWRDGAVLCPYESQCPALETLVGLPDGIAHVKSTSGSTGKARFVLFREEQLLADASNIASTMGFEAQHPNLAVISVAHSYGFSHLILPLLLQGKPVWLVNKPLPEAMRTAFSSGTPLFLPAVPAMWRAWHHCGLLTDAPIHLAMSAGAPLPLELEKQVYEETGLKIHNFYGASECGGIAYDRTERPRARATLVGTPLDGVTLCVDQSGHMVVNGENVGFGYWPNTDPDVPLGNNQFTLPDLVEITTEGVDLIGRRTDAINVAGRKVSPSEIECALLTHPAVRHCVVFGVPSSDSARVEDIVACLNAGGNIGITEIGEHLKGRLQGWQIPRKWLFTESLEPNDRGKISRSHWRSFFLNKGGS